MWKLLHTWIRRFIRITSEFGTMWPAFALKDPLRLFQKATSLLCSAVQFLTESHIKSSIKLLTFYQCLFPNKTRFVRLLNFFFLASNISVPCCTDETSQAFTVSVCMISVPILLFIFLPPLCNPFASRSLYRNRSFLRIPLAARPRFSSLRSLRFVLPHSAAN